MKFQEAFDLAPGRGWLTIVEAQALWDALESVQARRVLEVGSYYGRSATVIAGYLSGFRPDVKLTLCDPFDDGHHFHGTGTPEAKDAVESIRNSMSAVGMTDYYTLAVRADLDFAASPTSGEYDLIFLDGDHSHKGTKASIDAWTSHIRDGGLMLLHDYCNGGGGLEIVRAVEESKQLKLTKHVDRMAVCEIVRA